MERRLGLWTLQESKVRNHSATFSLMLSTCIKWQKKTHRSKFVRNAAHGLGDLLQRAFARAAFWRPGCRVRKPIMPTNRSVSGWLRFLSGSPNGFAGACKPPWLALSCLEPPFFKCQPRFVHDAAPPCGAWLAEACAAAACCRWAYPSPGRDRLLGMARPARQRRISLGVLAATSYWRRLHTEAWAWSIAPATRPLIEWWLSS